MNPQARRSSQSTTAITNTATTIVHKSPMSFSLRFGQCRGVVRRCREGNAPAFARYRPSE